MEWSPQQDQALRAVQEWYDNWDENAPPWFYLAGFAGTGKTTLARHFAADSSNPKFMAYTGKAADVMRQAGCAGATTIHSQVYIPVSQITDPEKLLKVPPDVDFVLNDESPLRSASLIIIDECSMVDEVMGEDLLRFGVPILVLGDPFQLAPVKAEEGFFTRDRPNFMLTDIHRQAKDNPIIAMSMDVRENLKAPDYGKYGDSQVVRVRQVVRGDAEIANEALKADQILVGRHDTRRDIIGRVRRSKGYDEYTPPQPGEKIICDRNIRNKGFMNGTMWNVLSCKEIRKYNMDFYDMRAHPLGEPEFIREPQVPAGLLRSDDDFRMAASMWHWVDQFKYGDAITTHKAQGSQWGNVMVLDESGIFAYHAKRKEEEGWEKAGPRWLYTAITRACEKVTIVR